MNISYYYDEIIHARLDFEQINFVLNEAIRDENVPGSSKEPQNYNYLCTVAKSLGFRFGENFELV